MRAERSDGTTLVLGCSGKSRLVSMRLSTPSEPRGQLLSKKLRNVSRRPKTLLIHFGIDRH
ncbi:MAG TPA: hypothetical protein DD670_13520 [Planctomycetaceae bacterium]|nr:hypothetical protein [Planctomycetaceae bacterium]